MNSASQESVPSKMRRQFTASEKLRLVKSAEAALATGERGALEAVLRKESIYSSQLSAWRQQLGTSGVAGLVRSSLIAITETSASRSPKSPMGSRERRRR